MLVGLLPWRIVGQFLDKFIAYLGYLGAAIGVASIVSMMLMITLNVTLRRFFNSSLGGVHEYSAYLLALLVYMGFAYTMRVEAHISIDLVIRQFSNRVRDGIETITSLLGLGLIGLYLWFLWELFMESWRVGIVATSPQATPLWIPQISLCIGLVFFSLELVARIVKKFIAFQKGGNGRGRLWDTAATPSE